MIVNNILHGLQKIFMPEKQRAPVVKKTEEIAIQKIKKSPGHMNLAKLNEEPEWFHD